jgi:hypothetical protein
VVLRGWPDRMRNTWMRKITINNSINTDNNNNNDNTKIKITK